MGRSLSHLPLSILKHILSYLTYEEVANLRLTRSHNIRKAAEFVLNDIFLSLPVKIEELVKKQSLRIRCTVKSLAANFCKYRVLLILLSEIRVLSVLCGRYIAANLCTFAAGSILDGFLRLLHVVDEESPVDCESYCVFHFLQCERYMNYFENVLEPGILQRNNLCAFSRYGTKMIDLLDCFHNSNYHLIVTHDGPYWHCTGKYETVYAAQITKPPTFNDFPCSDPEAFRSIARYIRNSVRWNNLLYFIEMTLESVKEVAEKNLEQISAGRTFRKMETNFKRHIRDVDGTAQGMVFALNIHSTRYLMPMHFLPYLAKTEGHHAIQEDLKKYKGYEFMMEIKLRHYATPDKRRLIETVIHIYLDEKDHTLSQHNSFTCHNKT